MKKYLKVYSLEKCFMNDENLLIYNYEAEYVHIYNYEYSYRFIRIKLLLL